MKITTLIEAASIFNRFAETKISSKLAYKIMKFCKAVAVEEDFYNTKRQALVDEYAVKDENGQIVVSDGMISIIPDKMDEAHKAMQELNSLEVEAPSTKFTLDELSALELSVADMFVLDVFVEE